MEIPQGLISFFRLNVTTFTCLQSVDYDYRKAAKKWSLWTESLVIQFFIGIEMFDRDQRFVWPS
jgi:hypothetical protein